MLNRVKWDQWLPPSVENPFDEDFEDDEETDSRDMFITHQSADSIERAHLTRQFNFWVAHTNFRITPRMINSIEDIDGVETLDSFTPYRFRVGVAQAFNDKEVRKSIEEFLIDYLKIGKKVNIIEFLRGHLKGRHKAWAILKMKNKIDVVTGSSRADVTSQIPGEGKIVESSF